MMEISRVFNVKNVYTYPNPGGQEDEIHIEIVGIGRLIIPKSMLRRIADALLDANTTGRLRSSGKQPAPEEPGPNRERADELFSELLLKLHPDHGIKLIELVGLYQKQDPTETEYPLPPARGEQT